jgi:hypothetical protein
MKLLEKKSVSKPQINLKGYTIFFIEFFNIQNDLFD